MQPGCVLANCVTSLPKPLIFRALASHIFSTYSGSSAFSPSPRGAHFPTRQTSYFHRTALSRSAWGVCFAGYCFFLSRSDLTKASSQSARLGSRLCACSYSGLKTQQLTGRAGHRILSYEVSQAREKQTSRPAQKSMKLVDRCRPVVAHIYFERVWS